MTDKAAEEIGILKGANEEHFCKACLEPLRQGAQVCPHCHSSQRLPSRWQYVSSVLKWIGGVTAILSFVALSFQVNAIFKDFRDRRETVENLIRSSETLADNKDYEGALDLIDQALQLNPSNQLARDRQLNFAMRRIREMWKFTKEKEKVLNISLSILRRGSGQTDSSKVSGVLAHLGWLQYIRDPYQAIIVEHFQDALEKDPQNVYGNAMWGSYCIRAKGLGPGAPDECGEDINAAAIKHFLRALEQDEEKDYVQNLAFNSLLERHSTSNWIDSLWLANEFRKMKLKSSENYAWGLCSRLAEILDFKDNEQQVLLKVPAKELKETIEQLDPDPENKVLTDEIVIARLLSLIGQKNEALEKLKKLKLLSIINRGHWPSGTSEKYYIDRSIAHILDLQSGRLGIKIEENSRLKAASNAVRIQQVTDNGAAAKAGLIVGDIIIKMNGQQVQSKRHVEMILGVALTSETIELTVERQGKAKNFMVTYQPGINLVNIGSAYSDKLSRLVNRAIFQSYEIWTPKGVIQVIELDADVRKTYSIQENINGVLVVETDIIVGSHLDLNYGDILYQVNNRKISNVKDFAFAVQEFKNHSVSEVKIRYRRLNNEKKILALQIQ